MVLLYKKSVMFRCIKHFFQQESVRADVKERKKKKVVLDYFFFLCRLALALFLRLCVATLCLFLFLPLGIFSGFSD